MPSSLIMLLLPALSATGLGTAEAQWTGGGKAICPPGSATVATGDPYAPYRCVRGGAQTKKNPRPRSAQPQPVAPPGRTPGSDCPRGTYPVPTNIANQPYFCSPVAEERVEARGHTSCGGFNTEFSAFFADEVQEYSRRADYHRETEERMISQIESQRALGEQLRYQSTRATHSGIRGHLRQQAKSVDRDVSSRMRRLRAAQSTHQGRESMWRQGFRQRAAQRLKWKPKGCKVEAAASTSER